MKDETGIILVVILVVAWLETWALYLGIDGTMLLSVFALLGGLAGYKGRTKIGEVIDKIMRR